MADLTGTHRAVLFMYADGYSRSEIATALDITPGKVKRLTREACKILGARNRTHAVALAWRRRELV